MEILEHPAPVDVLLVGFGAVGVVYAYMSVRSALSFLLPSSSSLSAVMISFTFLGYD
jgi:hypothetical protein